MNVWNNVSPGTAQQVIMDWFASNGGSATTADIARLLESRGSPCRSGNARSPLDALSKKGLVEVVSSKRGPQGFTNWKLVAEPLMIVSEEQFTEYIWRHPLLGAIGVLQERIRVLEETVEHIALKLEGPLAGKEKL